VVKIALWDPLAASSAPPQSATVVSASSDSVVRDLIEIKASTDWVL
jgi:hypothetical protein